MVNTNRYGLSQTHREQRNTYKSMLENPKRNRSLEIPRNKSEYNIKIHLREIR